MRLSNLTLRDSQTIFWTIFISMEYLTVRDTTPNIFHNPVDYIILMYVCKKIDVRLCPLLDYIEVDMTST